MTVGAVHGEHIKISRSILSGLDVLVMGFIAEITNVLFIQCNCVCFNLTQSTFADKIMPE